MRSDLKKLDSFTLETSKNHLIRNFLRNGRLRVKISALKGGNTVRPECRPGNFAKISPWKQSRLSASWSFSLTGWTKSFVKNSVIFKTYFIPSSTISTRLVNQYSSWTSEWSSRKPTAPCNEHYLNIISLEKRDSFSNYSTVKIYKSRKGWSGGARETHWATCHNEVTPSKTQEFLDSSCFLRS